MIVIVSSQDEIVQVDTPEHETSQTDTDDEDKPVPIRRSTREWRPPLRFTTGEFETASLQSPQCLIGKRRSSFRNILQTRQLFPKIYRQRLVEPF